MQIQLKLNVWEKKKKLLGKTKSEQREKTKKGLLKISVLRHNRKKYCK